MAFFETYVLKTVTMNIAICDRNDQSARVCAANCVYCEVNVLYHYAKTFIVAPRDFTILRCTLKNCLDVPMQSVQLCNVSVKYGILCLVTYYLPVCFIILR